MSTFRRFAQVLVLMANVEVVADSGVEIPERNESASQLPEACAENQPPASDSGAVFEQISVPQGAPAPGISRDNAQKTAPEEQAVLAPSDDAAAETGPLDQDQAEQPPANQDVDPEVKDRSQPYDDPRVDDITAKVVQPAPPPPVAEAPAKKKGKRGKGKESAKSKEAEPPQPEPDSAQDGALAPVEDVVPEAAAPQKADESESKTEVSNETAAPVEANVPPDVQVDTSLEATTTTDSSPANALDDAGLDKPTEEPSNKFDQSSDPTAEKNNAPPAAPSPPSAPIDSPLEHPIDDNFASIPSNDSAPADNDDEINDNPPLTAETGPVDTTEPKTDKGAPSSPKTVTFAPGTPETKSKKKKAAKGGGKTSRSKRKKSTPAEESADDIVAIVDEGTPEDAQSGPAVDAGLGIDLQDGVVQEAPPEGAGAVDATGASPANDEGEAKGTSNEPSECKAEPEAEPEHDAATPEPSPAEDIQETSVTEQSPAIDDVEPQLEAEPTRATELSPDESKEIDDTLAEFTGEPAQPPLAEGKKKKKKDMDEKSSRSEPQAEVAAEPLVNDEPVASEPAAEPPSVEETIVSSQEIGAAVATAEALGEIDEGGSGTNAGAFIEAEVAQQEEQQASGTTEGIAETSETTNSAAATIEATCASTEPTTVNASEMDARENNGDDVSGKPAQKAAEPPNTDDDYEASRDVKDETAADLGPSTVDGTFHDAAAAEETQQGAVDPNPAEASSEDVEASATADPQADGNQDEDKRDANAEDATADEKGRADADTTSDSEGVKSEEVAGAPQDNAVTEQKDLDDRAIDEPVVEKELREDGSADAITEARPIKEIAAEDKEAEGPPSEDKAAVEEATEERLVEQQPDAIGGDDKGAEGAHNGESDPAGEALEADQSSAAMDSKPEESEDVGEGALPAAFKAIAIAENEPGAPVEADDSTGDKADPQKLDIEVVADDARAQGSTQDSSLGVQGVPPDVTETADNNESAPTTAEETAPEPGVLADPALGPIPNPSPAGAIVVDIAAEAPPKTATEPETPPSPTLSKTSSKRHFNSWQRPARKRSSADLKPSNPKTHSHTSKPAEPTPRDRPRKLRRSSKTATATSDDSERRKRRRAEIERIRSEEAKRAEEEELRRIRHEERRKARKRAAEETMRLQREEEAEAERRRREEKRRSRHVAPESAPRSSKDAAFARPGLIRKAFTVGGGGGESVTKAGLLIRTSGEKARAPVGYERPSKPEGSERSLHRGSDKRRDSHREDVRPVKPVEGDEEKRKRVRKDREREKEKERKVPPDEVEGEKERKHRHRTHRTEIDRPHRSSNGSSKRREAERSSRKPPDAVEEERKRGGLLGVLRKVLS